MKVTTQMKGEPTTSIYDSQYFSFAPSRLRCSIADFRLNEGSADLSSCSTQRDRDTENQDGRKIRPQRRFTHLVNSFENQNHELQLAFRAQCLSASVV